MRSGSIITVVKIKTQSAQYPVNQLQKNKAKAILSAKMVLASVFWNSRDLVLLITLKRIKPSMVSIAYSIILDLIKPQLFIKCGFIVFRDILLWLSLRTISKPLKHNSEFVSDFWCRRKSLFMHLFLVPDQNCTTDESLIVLFDYSNILFWDELCHSWHCFQCYDDACLFLFQGSITSWSVFPKKQVSICFKVLWARTTSIGFGSSWNTPAVNCCLIFVSYASMHDSLWSHTYISFKEPLLYFWSTRYWNFFRLYAFQREQRFLTAKRSYKNSYMLIEN